MNRQMEGHQMRVFTTAVTFVLVGSVFASQCEADLMIQPVAISTDMGSASSTSWELGNVIDQSGLSEGYVSGVTDASSYTATHSGSQDYSWLSETPTGFVTFDLGGAFPLRELRLWNTSAAVGGGFTQAEDFALFSDSDSDPTNGTTGYLGSFIAASSADMQVFGIDATTQFVHMQIISNGGSTRTTLGEVAFAAVPEPSTFALLGIAGLVGGFVAWRRRRRT
jgi:hypothetical protein